MAAPAPRSCLLPSILSAWQAVFQLPLGWGVVRPVPWEEGPLEAWSSFPGGRAAVSITLFFASVRVPQMVTAGTSRTKTAWEALDG